MNARIFDTHEPYSNMRVAKFFERELNYKDLLFLQRNGNGSLTSLASHSAGNKLSPAAFFTVGLFCDPCLHATLKWD